MTDTPTPAKVRRYTASIHMHTDHSSGPFVMVMASDHDAALSAERARSAELENQLHTAIERLRRAEPETLAWLKALDERPLPKSDEGTLFDYHGMACVLMPEQEVKALETDARRYRWFRSPAAKLRQVVVVNFDRSLIELLAGEELDAACDAAIAAAGEKGE